MGRASTGAARDESERGVMIVVVTTDDARRDGVIRLDDRDNFTELAVDAVGLTREAVTAVAVSTGAGAWTAIISGSTSTFSAAVGAEPTSGTPLSQRWSIMPREKGGPTPAAAGCAPTSTGSEWSGGRLPHRWQWITAFPDSRSPERQSRPPAQTAFREDMRDVVSTVRFPMINWAAISLFVIPRATRPAISRSRFVKCCRTADLASTSGTRRRDRWIC